MKQEAEQWLELAAKDLKSARKLADEEDLFDLACFHCHQVVEKCLKGFLARTKAEIPKTHDLGRLGQACAALDEEFFDVAEAVLELDVFYMGTRYPPRAGMGASAENLKGAMTVAERVLNLVTGKLA